MKEIIIDDQLYLTPLKMTDAQSLFDLVDRNRSYLRKFLGWLDRTHGIKDTEWFIDNDIKGRSTGSVAYGIFFDSKLAGVISYHDYKSGNKRTAIGYWLSNDLQGNGIVSRSVSALIENGFKNLDLNRIEICCATENIPSQKIPESLGFKKEGICRSAEVLYGDVVDHYIYSLLKEDYKS